MLYFAFLVVGGGAINKRLPVSPCHFLGVIIHRERERRRVCWIIHSIDAHVIIIWYIFFLISLWPLDDDAPPVPPRGFSSNTARGISLLDVLHTSRKIKYIYTSKPSDVHKLVSNRHNKRRETNNDHSQELYSSLL